MLRDRRSARNKSRTMECLRDAPIDTLRTGLGSLKHDVTAAHPLEASLQVSATSATSLSGGTSASCL